MIDIKIRQYHITSNKYGYQVRKMKLADGQPMMTYDANGNEVIDQTLVGYYPSLRYALAGIKKYIVQNGDIQITSIDEYVETVKSIEELFDEAVVTKSAVLIKEIERSD
ncbi:hypothetical protein IWT25_02178 [Secundilactobacillus pentosiphilus]|uniref:DUF5405 domain-containing protein n=1 Tax=Secundilactobacillus pentosiphilus TaxID=1714682 RepID=A0A1Z5IZD3_9LACO|nr:hypothetical protein [Secundilactobacillus pentosiphilus]GAX06831.1 hypothetical protein IWT25_02178 [Secundilactobacillus pentosiphilus]